MRGAGGIHMSDFGLRYVASFMFYAMVMYGLYVHMHGDYSPGGGFQGGVIVASALVLHAMTFGDRSTRDVLPCFFAVGAIGLLIYVSTGLASMFLGGSFLSYVFGVSNTVAEQKLGVFVVELGVGLTVCAAVASMYFDFASWKNDIN